MSTKEEYVELLNFRHFGRYMRFSKTDPRGAKKEISNHVNVSVVSGVTRTVRIYMGCANKASQNKNI